MSASQPPKVRAVLLPLEDGEEIRRHVTFLAKDEPFKNLWVKEMRAPGGRKFRRRRPYGIRRLPSFR